MHFRFPLLDLGFVTILVFSFLGATLEVATLKDQTIALLASASGLG
jgi:hypothetical protein